MSLLHHTTRGARTKLLFAGFATVLAAGVLGSSSVSALEGFSISDIISNYQSQMEQLQTYLTNPLSTGCESSSPDSTISCNEAPFPNLLFNGAPNNSTWGHDGKGVIFVDNENLIDGNPQLATAKRGDTLKYSMEIETQRYNDEAMTSPVEAYTVYGLFSEGLVVNPESVVVKVGEQVLAGDDYMFEYIDDLGGEGAMLGGAKSALVIAIGWRNGNSEFRFDEDAKITITLSATIAEDAPGEVWGKGAYLNDQSHGGIEVFQPTGYKATALIDGNILIRRVDANGNPLAGAKYTVDGVKANVENEADSVYLYDKNGTDSEFTTDSEGKVLIRGVPMGEYTVREIQAPAAHDTSTPIIVKPVYEDVSTIEYGDKKYELDYGFFMIDITRYIELRQLDDGRSLIGYGEFQEVGGNPNASDSIIYTYDQSEGKYVNGPRQSSIEKTSNGYRLEEQGDSLYNLFSHDFIYDSSLERFVSHRSYFDVFGTRRSSYESLVIDGTTAIVKDSGKSVELHLSENGEEYIGQATTSEGQQDLALRQTKTGYRLEVRSGDTVTYSLPYYYNDTLGLYLPDFDVFIYTIEEESEEELVVNMYYPIEYSPEFGHYYMSAGGMVQRGIRVSRNSLFASEFLFRDKANDTIPEGISNPQTGDAVLKAAAVASLCAALMLIFRKRTRF